MSICGSLASRVYSSKLDGFGVMCTRERFWGLSHEFSGLQVWLGRPNHEKIYPVESESDL